MEKFALFVDDAEQASRLLGPLLPPAADPVRWIVVACAPRLVDRLRVRHGSDRTAALTL